MIEPCTRRLFLGGALGTVVAACGASRIEAPTSTPSPDAHAFIDIERRVGGRVGVFALDTSSGRHVDHRPDELFAMCSTFKWLLAGAVLARIDSGQLERDERLPYGATDLLDYAPVTGRHVGEGTMTIDALAEAAVTMSDNTASNLLLGKIGGPSGLTKFVRARGDAVTRLDSLEPNMNENAPADPRDTTSPRAMVALMREVLCGDALSASSQARLIGWMRACETGKARLRAGLPTGWTVGDKTGTGASGAVNDVAIAWPPGRRPILIAAYVADGQADLAAKERAHADIARLVARQL